MCECRFPLAQNSEKKDTMVLPVNIGQDKQLDVCILKRLDLKIFFYGEYY